MKLSSCKRGFEKKQSEAAAALGSALIHFRGKLLGCEERLSVVDPI